MSRVLGWKTGRVHHFLSDIETHYFYLLDWADDVTDIREQYPLPRAGTQAIASELSIRHPQDPKTKIDIVITTDFMVTIGPHGRKDRVLWISKNGIALIHVEAKDALPRIESRAAIEQLIIEGNAAAPAYKNIRSIDEGSLTQGAKQIRDKRWEIICELAFKSPIFTMIREEGGWSLKL